MKIDLFDYNLPNNKIAQAPVRPRERAKMLVYDRRSQIIRDRHVSDLAEFLQAGDLLVLNVTKVRHARLWGERLYDQGKTPVEVLVLKPKSNGQFECLLRGKHLTVGERIVFPASTDLQPLTQIVGRLEEPPRFILQVENMTEVEFLQFGEKFGNLPLPPYIHNPQIAGFEDELYQPLIAKQLGSIAAPTASLHFSSQLLNDLKKRGVGTTSVVLHVGLGTFMPMRVADTDDHHMHTEEVEVPAEAVAAIHATKQNGGRVVAVGTTVARALESAAKEGRLVEFKGETDLFITPGFRFQVVDSLLTNFHLPKSTLLLLVAAFIGQDKWLELYEHALDSDYRFLSFGDCMLLV